MPGVPRALRWLQPRTSKRRWCIVLLLLAAGLAAAPWWLSGRRFGAVVEWALPDSAGRVHVAGGSWSWADVVAGLCGRPVSFLLEGVRVEDASGHELLQARRVSGRIESWRRPLVLGRLRVEDARVHFVQSRGQPAAVTSKPTVWIRRIELHRVGVELRFADWSLSLRDTSAAGWVRYDPTSGAQPMRFGAREAEVRGGGRLMVGRSLAFPWSSARLDRLGTTDEAPHALDLRVSRMRIGRSTLSLEAVFTGVCQSDTSAASVDLQARVEDAGDALGAAIAGTAWAKQIAVGPAGRLSFQLRGPWSDLRVAAEGTALAGRWRGLDIEALDLRLAAAPARARLRIQRLSLRQRGGGRLQGFLRVDGPRLRGSLSLAAFHSTPLLPSPLVSILSGRVDGMLRARVDLARGAGSVERAALVLRRASDLSGVRVVEVSLDAAAPPGPRPRSTLSLRLSELFAREGVVRVPRLRGALWGGRLTAGGEVELWDPGPARWLDSPRMEAEATVDQLAIERLLGPGLVTGTLSFRIRARGTLTDLGLELWLPPGQMMVVLTEPFLLPPELRFRVDRRGVQLPATLLRGQGSSQLTARGHIGFDGRLDVLVGLGGYPFARLPGLAETTLPLGGRLSGEVRLRGSPDRPTVAGRLSLDQATFQERPVGAGALVITAGRRGAICARGHLIEGIAASGFLRPSAAGLTGEATLALEGLRLDPFLGPLPAGFAAVGEAWGTVVARVAPGRSASADGQLTRFMLTIIGARAPATLGYETPPETTLESEGAVPIFAESGGGPLRLGPARFVGPVGNFLISGQTEGGAMGGAIQGRIDLGELAPLASRWLESLTGMADVDLAATGQAGSPLELDGALAVAAPISFRARAAPFTARIPSGSVLFRGDRLETLRLPVTLEGGTFEVTGSVRKRPDAPLGLAVDVAGTFDAAVAARLEPLSIRRATGTARIDLEVRGTSDRPRLRGRIEPDRLELDLPGATDSLEISGGAVDLTNRTLAISDVGVRLGSQVRLWVGGAGDPAGLVRLAPGWRPRLAFVDLPLRGELALRTPSLVVEESRFALRLSGDPRRSLKLEGDALVLRARTARRSSPAATPVMDVSWLSRPPLASMSLDVGITSREGALTLELPYLPDPRVDVDFHLGGLASRPELSGRMLPTSAYGSLVLWVDRRLR